MAGIGDELMLTTLTVILTTFLCIRYGQSVEFSSIVLIIANILGYALGTGIATLVRLANPPDNLVRGDKAFSFADNNSNKCFRSASFFSIKRSILV